MEVYSRIEYLVFEIFKARLIGLTDTALKELLVRAWVTMETLGTTLTDTEAILNNRLLTYESTDRPYFDVGEVVQ